MALQGLVFSLRYHTLGRFGHFLTLAIQVPTRPANINPDTLRAIDITRPSKNTTEQMFSSGTKVDL